MDRGERPSASNAVAYSVNRTRPGTVRLWTVQPIPVWEALNETGMLWAEPRFDDPDDQRIFGEAYDWMRDQMRRRLPSYEGHYPWWAYDYKLDLRSWQVYGTEITPQVRLELAVEPERVLLSAYGDWHYVLNKSYLPHAIDERSRDLEEARWVEEIAARRHRHQADDPLPEPWRSQMAASWERIFAVEELRETNTIQACFERLELADVVRVTDFTPRLRRKR